LKAEGTFNVITTYQGPDKVAHPLTEAVARQRIESGNGYRFAIVLRPISCRRKASGCTSSSSPIRATRSKRRW